MSRTKTTASVAKGKTTQPALSPSTPRKLDLSRIRHDLRTPINHILGYCEMLLVEESVPR